MAVVTAFLGEFGQRASFEYVREPPHIRCLAESARSAWRGRSVSCSVQHLQLLMNEPMKPSTQPGETPLNPSDEGPPDAPGVGEDACQACRGRGTVEGVRCAVCGGTGQALAGRQVADTMQRLW